MVLEEVVGEYQPVFIGGRQIIDAIMVASKVVDEIVKSRREGILGKLDMKKAYDHVNWEFVDYMMD